MMRVRQDFSNEGTVIADQDASVKAHTQIALRLTLQARTKLDQLAEQISFL